MPDPILGALLPREALLRPLFRLGDTEVTLTTILVALVVLLVGWGLAEAARAGLLALARHRRLPRSVGRLLGETAYFSALTLALLVSLASLGVNLLAAVAAFAVAGLALALALQDTLANVVAGVSLSLDEPFRRGDRVRVEDATGIVESVGLRATRVLTEEGARVIVPNRILVTREVWNLTPRPEDGPPGRATNA